MNSESTPPKKKLRQQPVDVDKSGEINEIEPNCQYYLQHKRRKCKALKKRGHYCTEHSYLLDGDDVGRKRIKCPMDPNHSVFEDSLEKHLKKCNKRPELRPHCFKDSINSGDNEGCDPEVFQVSLRSVNESEVLEMVEIVEKLYNEHIGSMRSEILFHESMQTEYENPNNGETAHKHILQQASLIGHMNRLGFLGDSHCFMEFGCGKGGLSHWIQKAVADCKDTQHLLVDRSSVRYKMDNFHKGADQGPSFERLKIDIEHLDIEKVANLNNNRKVIAVGKHLCGAATDLMLRCITRLEPHPQYTRLMSGVVLALCCHHRCHWRAYTGKRFVRDTCGLSAYQFHIMCSMTSWATCATQHVNTDSNEHQAPTYNHPRFGNLLPQQREATGNKCKQLIDRGRAEFLREHGFSSDLVAFVDKKYTLENVCLLAHRKPNLIAEEKDTQENVTKPLESAFEQKEIENSSTVESCIDKSCTENQQNIA